MTEAAAIPPPLPAQLDHEEHRLHPWSWLFVTLQHLKQFIFPLLALLFFGRGDRYEFWPLIGVGVLALASIWQYFTYRYRITSDRIEVRSGLLERKLRQIPFSRIHNVALHQTLLHRIFGVAEVRLESAGGAKPEAEMRVLRMDKALALEQLVRRRAATTTDTAASDDAPASHVLLAMDIGDVIRHGIVSNRGLVLVAAGFAGLQQFAPKVMANAAERIAGMATGYADAHHFGWQHYALAAMGLLAFGVVLMRLLSIAVSLLQFYGFTLSEAGSRLTVVRGLLTRLRTSVRRRRIQAWFLRESVVHRWLKRRELSVQTAVVDAGNDAQKRSVRELAPIATPQACDDLIHHLLPHVQWPPAQWSPLHARTWLRWWLPEWLWTVPITAALIWRFGSWGWLGLLWLPWSAFLSIKAAQNAGFHRDAQLLAVRKGWWSKQWRFAEIGKLQGLQLKRSPMDRLFGMARLHADIAGGNALGGGIEIPCLSPTQADELQRSLARQLARDPLRW